MKLKNLETWAQQGKRSSRSHIVSWTQTRPAKKVPVLGSIKQCNLKILIRNYCRKRCVKDKSFQEIWASPSLLTVRKSSVFSKFCVAAVRRTLGGRPQSTWFPFLLRCLVLSSCEMSTHIFTYSIYWTLDYTHNNVWNSGYWTLPHQCKSIYSILLDLHYIFYLFSAGPLYKFCALGHNRIQDWA